MIDFLVRDADNPSSILSCLETARRNARAARTALTVDMWESLNDTWLELRSRGSAGEGDDRIVEFLEWVKQRSMLFNGAYANTMLRNDAFYFTQLGTYLERADNTARMLDVKYHVLLPAPDGGGRRARPRPVGVDAARRLGAARLPLGVPRAPGAVDDRRPADPAARDAALAARLLRADHALPRAAGRRSTAASAASATAGPGRSRRGCATAASTRSSRRACTSS